LLRASPENNVEQCLVRDSATTTLLLMTVVDRNRAHEPVFDSRAMKIFVLLRRARFLSKWNCAICVCGWLVRKLRR